MGESYIKLKCTFLKTFQLCWKLNMFRKSCKSFINLNWQFGRKKEVFHLPNIKAMTWKRHPIQTAAILIVFTYNYFVLPTDFSARSISCLIFSSNSLSLCPALFSGFVVVSDLFSVCKETTLILGGCYDGCCESMKWLCNEWSI